MGLFHAEQDSGTLNAVELHAWKTMFNTILQIRLVNLKPAQADKYIAGARQPWSTEAICLSPCRTRNGGSYSRAGPLIVGIRATRRKRRQRDGIPLEIFEQMAMSKLMFSTKRSATGTGHLRI